MGLDALTIVLLLGGFSFVALGMAESTPYRLDRALQRVTYAIGWAMIGAGLTGLTLGVVG